MDKVSVIVPVYNVEKYLNKCVYSLLNQTYKNIEILLIDDGSKDNSGMMCDQLKNKDSRIKVYHKENGGLSDARNYGINQATGKYICFVDSDDYVEIDYVLKMYMGLKDNNVKISQCGINYVDDSNNYIYSIGYESNKVQSGRQMILDINNSHGVENTVAWNRLYDISLFKDIRFPYGKIHEDEFTTYKLYYNNNVFVIKDKLYNYRQSPNSIMHKKYSLNRLDALEAYKEKIEFFRLNKDIEIYDSILFSYLNLLIYTYINVKREHKNEKKILKNIVREFRRFYYKVVKKVSFKKKIKFSLFYFCPTLYFLLKKGE